MKFSRTPGETAEAIAAFKETTNNKIPQAAGAIGSIHIIILDPSTDHKVDYYNRKEKYSINLQVAVGRDLFLDFCTGFPGSVHNTRALHDHQFMQRLELGKF